MTVWAEVYNQTNTGAKLGATDAHVGDQLLDAALLDTLQTVPELAIEFARDATDHAAFAVGNVVRLMSDDSGSDVEVGKFEIRSITDSFIGVETTKVKGPTLKAKLKDALIRTWQPNVGLEPQEKDTRTWGFATPDRGWADFTDVAYLQTSHPLPRRWPDPYTQGVWCASDSLSHPAGRVFGVREFTLATELPMVFNFSADDGVEAVWVDGVRVGSAPWVENQNVNVWEEARRVPLILPAGDHVFGIEAMSIGGPAMVWASGWSTDSGYTDPVFITGEAGHGPYTGTWHWSADPATRPGVPVGRPLVDCFAECQAENALTGWTLGFTATHDSDSVAWPTAEVTTKVDQSVFDLATELERTWMVTRVRDGAGMVLDAFNLPYGADNSYVLPLSRFEKRDRVTSI